MGLLKFVASATKLAEKANEMAEKAAAKANELLEEDDNRSSGSVNRKVVADWDGSVLTIAEGVTHLEGDDIEDITGVEKVVFPSTLKELDSDFFEENKDVEEIDFSKVTMLKTIEDYLFDGLEEVHEVVLPEGVETIKSYAFCNCMKLERIVLPSTLRECEVLADDCPNLDTVDTSKVHLLKTLSQFFVSGDNCIRCFYIPEGVTKVEAYPIDGDSIRELHVPSSVRELNGINGDGKNNVTVYLHSDQIENIVEFHDDVEELFVHERSYQKYKDMLAEEDSEVMLTEMPDDKTYGNGDSKVSATNVASVVAAVQQNKETAQQQSVQSATPPPSPVPPPPPVFKYFAMLEGKQEGPYDEPQFTRLVQYGMLTADTYVWTEGMAEWKMAGEVAALARFFRPQAPGAVPPPMPSF